VSSLEEANVSPTYQCCKFRGSVLAYDARTGARQWHTFLIKPAHRVGKNVAGAKKFGPAGASIWNTPAIDEKRAQLTVGTGNDYSSPSTDASDAVVALDLATGKVKWVHQAVSNDGWNASCSVPDKALCPQEDGPDYDFGAATMITKASDGRDIVLGGEKSGDVLALDPDDGHQLWKTKVGRGGILAGIYFGMAASGDSVFVPISDMDDGRKYQQPAQPGLYALNLLTGEFLWKAPASPTACEGRKSCSPGIAAAITATPDLVLTGASDGWLRIYDSASGKVLWQFDTVQSFNTVGGGTGMGGAIGGGAAPIAYHGTLIAPSGYGFANQRQGNVLLVFDIAN
jgi:polyvinyl alcohol dehydrogenase (cytochrome)